MKAIHGTSFKKAVIPALDIKAARIAAINSSHGHLTTFLRSRGYAPSTAWVAMQGKLRGPKALRIVEEIKREFGL